MKKQGLTEKELNELLLDELGKDKEELIDEIYRLIYEGPGIFDKWNEKTMGRKNIGWHEHTTKQLRTIIKACKKWNLKKKA